MEKLAAKSSNPVAQTRIPKPKKSIDIRPKIELEVQNSSTQPTERLGENQLSKVPKKIHDRKVSSQKNAKTSYDLQQIQMKLIKANHKIQTTEPTNVILNSDHKTSTFGDDRHQFQKKKSPDNRLIKTETQEKEEEKQNTMGKAIALFAERVGIAGIEDIHKAKIKAERWMYLAAMILSCVGMIVTCIGIWLKYANTQINYDHYPIAGYQPPFPNVTICYPNNMNTTILKQLLVIPEKTKSLIKKSNADLQEVIDYTMIAWSYDQNLVPAKSQVIADASIQIMDATALKFPSGFAGILLSVYPPCNQTLLNCSFYGQEFDCCEAAEFIFTDEPLLCYYISVSKIAKFKNMTVVTGGEVDDPIHLDSSSLSVTIGFDWSTATYFDDIAEDGFYAYAGAMFTAVAVTVPSGADAIMTIDAAKRVDLTQCQPNDNLPKMQFFDYYDPLAVTLMVELNVLRMMRDTVGCAVPILTYVPKNITPCAPGYVYFIKLFKSTMEKISMSASETSGKTDQISLARDYLKSALPICHRWEYKIATASYGYVQKRGQLHSEPERRQSGKVWSRIRFFFPSASYMFVEEQSPSPPYGIVCEIGGAVGVYFGVSIISVVQLFVYGFIVLYFFVKSYTKRENRVGVAE